MSLFTIIWRFVEKIRRHVSWKRLWLRKNRDKSFQHRENCFCPLALFLNGNHFNQCFDLGLSMVIPLLTSVNCSEQIGNHFQKGKRTYNWNCLIQSYPRQGAGRAKITKRQIYKHMAIWSKYMVHLRCSLRSNQSKLGLPQKKDTTQSTLRQCLE